MDESPYIKFRLNHRNEQVYDSLRSFCPNSKQYSELTPIRKTNGEFIYLCVCCNIEWPTIYKTPSHKPFISKTTLIVIRDVAAIYLILGFIGYYFS